MRKTDDNSGVGYKHSVRKKLSNIKRVLISNNQDGKHDKHNKRKSNVFYVKDTNSDFHTQYGYISKNNLKKKSGIVKTNLGNEFFILEPNYRDLFNKIRRGPQIISLKDIGLIIEEAGINKKSFVVDAGTGSGALAIMLALISKKVVSYEIRKDFYNIALENKNLFGAKNLTIKNKSVKEITEKNVDAIILDLPQPQDFIEEVSSSLKIGAYLITYLPNINQVERFNEKIRALFNEEKPNAKNSNKETAKKGLKLIHLKTVELLKREWIIDAKRLRPESDMIAHTAFISFYRRVL